MMPSPAQPRRPWYREPWPWLILSIPAASIVAGLAMLVLAVRTNDGLVVDDYYKQGLGINRLLDRQASARALGVRATLRFDGDRGAIRLALQETGTAPERVTLKLVHPTRAGEDRLVVLVRTGESDYEGTLRALPPGRWNVIIEDAAGIWRLAGEWRTDQAVLALAASGE